jgi:hypothetical protein
MHGFREILERTGDTPSDSMDCKISLTEHQLKKKCDASNQRGERADSGEFKISVTIISHRKTAPGDGQVFWGYKICERG